VVIADLFSIVFFTCLFGWMKEQAAINSELDTILKGLPLDCSRVNMTVETATAPFPVPVFKKLAVWRMLVTFNGEMYCQTKGGNGIRPFKPPPAFDAFNGFSPWGRTRALNIQLRRFRQQNTLPDRNPL
jgi:hypothetical protein